jgi:precorrin-6B C5,15-methyltransferase / cobalt-precorrin-6B C5,C15-methyltransferase
MLKWLSVVGIGEDGLAGVSAMARSLIERAEVLVGGERHLAMLPTHDLREKLVWSSPIAASLDEIRTRRGQLVCVLASGDPMCFGIGVTLVRTIPISEMSIIPAPSAFSLACARLGWSLAEVETLSLCGRPPALIQASLYPGARLLMLSEGKETPGTVAKFLTQWGYGRSELMVLEHLGGEREQIVEGIAASWGARDSADLNTIAVTCLADPGGIPLTRRTGLPDSAYHHDGQLTKSEVRAVTLAALAPVPGQLLWDVGAGCGSVAIEWMRSHSRCRAIAIEPSRTHYIADNATALGTPNLQIIEGIAPLALKDLPQPDAIFLGGGATAEGMFETCWTALHSGGRFVANIVTLEGEQKLLEWHQHVGGTLTRIEIQRAEPIGSFLGWKPMAPVTQWLGIKP